MALTGGRRGAGNLPIGQVPELPPTEAVLLIEDAEPVIEDAGAAILLTDGPEETGETALVRKVPDQCGYRVHGTTGWTNEKKGERCRSIPNPRNCVWSKNGRTRWTCHEPGGSR